MKELRVNIRQFGNDPHSAVNHLKIDGDGCLSRVVSGPVESLLYRLLYGVTLCRVIYTIRAYKCCSFFCI